MKKPPSRLSLTNTGYNVIGSCFGSAKVIAKFKMHEYLAAFACAEKVNEICKLPKNSVERWNSLFDLAKSHGLIIGKRIEPEG